MSNAVHVNKTSLLHIFEKTDRGVRFLVRQPELPFIVVHKMHGTILDLAHSILEGVSFELLPDGALTPHVEAFDAIKAKMKELQ